MECVHSLRLPAARAALAKLLSQPQNARKHRMQTSSFMALRSLVLAALDRCLEAEDWQTAAAILDAGSLLFHSCVCCTEC